MVGKCPVHWVSKLQSEVAVSTMEAEYIVLSTTMWGLIPLRTLASEAHAIVGGADLPCWTYSKVFEDNNGAPILANTLHMTLYSKHIAIKYHFFQGTCLLGSHSYSQGLQL